MIELRDLALGTPDGSWLLEGIELLVPKGGNHLITGPSGCGKSRLLKVIAGTERPARGLVRVDGREIWPGDGVLSLTERVRVGFAFASGGLLSNLSVWQNVALPLRFRGIPAEEVRVRAGAALERLGLQSVAELRPHALSASARKLGNLARVMALDAELILLDDPLEGLDAADRGRALGLVRGWIADATKTLLIALEDSTPFAELALDRLELRAPSIPLESP
ncbi:hypothetical protein GETHLI_03550 [Geothrix limicola]|uniref:ABC transporter domain-containing protein n=1 Tax=Geothrix limicola TaxID=2927978 RepID=A0ABQ5QB78_9BACT|nr:ATP-binding cassette domain-containing protein [Geothrix limicola]GLH71853.1 hypothetical protein GETHLI_03550 [Geothrix limicola]